MRYFDAKVKMGHPAHTHTHIQGASSKSGQISISLYIVPLPNVTLSD